MSFRLTNRTKYPSPFEAHITEESDACFDVESRKGMLDGFGCNGTVFYVTFRPTENRVKYNGLVVVETGEMVWTFRVVGRLTKYYPPNATLRNA